MVLIFLPIVRTIDTSRSVGRVKSKTKRRLVSETSNIKDSSGLIRENNCTRAEHIRFDMHHTPSTRRIIDKTQIEFVCASGSLDFGRAVFLEKGNFSVNTDSSKYGWHRARKEALR